MKIKCEYCGNFISTSDKICKKCGGENSHYLAPNSPQTLSELNTWVLKQDKSILDKLSVGEPSNKPSTVCIYQDPQDNLFKVYMTNKFGGKVDRYSGKDEQYAVREFYMKAKEIILENQRSKSLAGQKKSAFSSTSKIGIKTFTPAIVFFIVIVFIVVISSMDFSNLFGIIRVKEGYYKYENQYYYVYDDYFYKVYEDGNWEYTSGGEIGLDFLKHSKKYKTNKQGNMYCEYKCRPLTYIEDGYYNYDNLIYYHQSPDLFEYKDEGWKKIELKDYNDLPLEFRNNAYAYYRNEYPTGIQRFEDTYFYNVDEAYYFYKNNAYYSYLGDWYVFEEDEWKPVKEIDKELHYNNKSYKKGRYVDDLPLTTDESGNTIRPKEFNNTKYYRD